MTPKSIKQIKQVLKRQGFCVVPKVNMKLREINNFAAANHLSLFVGYADNYVLRVNTIQEEFRQAEKRERQRHFAQHVLFTILATFFFLILWLDLFEL